MPDTKKTSQADTHMVQQAMCGHGVSRNGCNRPHGQCPCGDPRCSS